MTVETLANYDVPEAYVKMYTANVQAALNKVGGILAPLVSQATYMGEKAQVVNFLGKLEFVERDTVYQDTQIQEIEHTQKWISGREYDCAILVDRLDTLKMLYTPDSPYVERMREAYARKQDEIIMGKFYSDVKTGKDGLTASPFGSSNTIVYNGTGMLVAKLRALRKLIKKRHVNLRTVRPYIAVTSQQTDDLLGEVAVGSSDYNAVKPLVDGEVGSFMGFNFVPYEDDGVSTNGKGIQQETIGGHVVRDCPCWVPEGMHWGSWSGLEISIDKRPDKNNIRQIHGTFTAGATRLEEGKVFMVQCQET